MAHERNCTVCGRQYKYCPKCSQYDGMEKWHVEYCSEQCKNTYSIINKYAFKHITEDEAKMLLKGNGITKDSILLPRWKESVKEILKTEEKEVVKQETKMATTQVEVSKPATKQTTKKTAVKRTTRKKKDIVNED